MRSARPGRNTTTTSDRPATANPRTNLEDNKDDIWLHRRGLQHNRPHDAQADHKAADTTGHQPNCCRKNDPTVNRPHASGQYQPGQVCKGRNGNSAPWVGDTMMRHPRRRPCPLTHRNAGIPPFNNRPTDRNNLLRTPDPRTNTTHHNGLRARGPSHKGAHCAHVVHTTA